MPVWEKDGKARTGGGLGTISIYMGASTMGRSMGKEQTAEVRRRSSNLRSGEGDRRADMGGRNEPRRERGDIQGSDLESGKGGVGQEGLHTNRKRGGQTWRGRKCGEKSRSKSDLCRRKLMETCIAPERKESSATGERGEPRFSVKTLNGRRTKCTKSKA